MSGARVDTADLAAPAGFGSAFERRLWWAAVLAVMVVGVSLRLIGLERFEMWADEAWWASKIVEGNPGWIRPPGYTLLTQFIARWQNTELSLRGPSVLAALIELPLLLWLLLRFVRPWVAVAVVYVLALHPAAINFAKEFKPYALEALLHTALWSCAVVYVTARNKAALWGAVIVAVVAAPLSWSTVFLYPGLFLALFFGAWRARAWRELAVAAGGAGVTLALLGVIFYLRLRTSNPHPEYWGDKYGVFYLGTSVVEKAQWLLTKTAEMVTYAVHLRTPFGEMPDIDPVSVVLGVVGVSVCVAAAVKKDPVRALLFVLPWVFFLLFNIVGAWPYGVFRTNHFSLMYTLVWLAFGADALWTFSGGLRARLRGAGPGVVVVVVLALALVFPLNWGRAARKARSARASVLQAVYLVQGAYGSVAKTAIYFDGQGCSVMSYYRDHHDGERGALTTWFDDHADVLCSQGRDPGYRRMMAGVIAAPPTSYFVINAKRSTTDYTARLLPENCAQVGRAKFVGTSAFWCGGADDPLPPGFARLAVKAPPSDATAAPQQRATAGDDDDNDKDDNEKDDNEKGDDDENDGVDKGGDKGGDTGAPSASAPS